MEKLELALAEKMEARFDELEKKVERIETNDSCRVDDWDIDDRDFCSHIRDGKCPLAYNGYVWLELIEKEIIEELESKRANSCLVLDLIKLYINKFGQSTKAGCDRLEDVIKEEAKGCDVSEYTSIILSQK